MAETKDNNPRRYARHHIESSSHSHLDDKLVRDGFEERGLVVLGPDDVSGSRSDGLSLEVRDGGAVLLALASGGVVALHAVQEILTAAGVTHMLSADANFLLFDAVAHGLGDDDAQRSVGHVENASSASVVVFVGHPRVHGSVGFDVDDISDLVDLQQGRDGRHSIFAEWTPEHVTRASAISLGIRHLYS